MNAPVLSHPSDTRGEPPRATPSDVRNLARPDTVVDRWLAQLTYQVALRSTGQMVQTSLLDFLR